MEIPAIRDVLCCLTVAMILLFSGIDYKPTVVSNEAYEWNLTMMGYNVIPHEKKCSLEFMDYFLLATNQKENVQYSNNIHDDICIIHTGSGIIWSYPDRFPIKEYSKIALKAQINNHTIYFDYNTTHR